MKVKFKQQLREAGLKVTGPRLEVFGFLQKHDLTTVSSVIRECAAGADRASVYRTLALFRKLGIIHDVVAGGKRMIELTDRFASHHHHLSCLECGRSETVSDQALESDLDRISKKNGFHQVSHQIDISGICARCQDRSSR
ncbi:MAG: Fur family transcriptional regulator [Thermoleophilia bacterium]